MTARDVMTALVALAWIAVTVVGRGACGIRPARARCPNGWSLATGIRSSGEFACWSPPASECRDALPGRSSEECHARYPEPVHVDSQIYCTGGSRPVVVDARTVGCQPGGWP